MTFQELKTKAIAWYNALKPTLKFAVTLGAGIFIGGMLF